MDRYVDVNKLIWQVQNNDKYGTITKQVFISLLQNSEMEDVAPVVHAHWIRWREPKVINPVYKCSNCEFDITVDESSNVDIGFWIEDFRYCLHCGAKMDEVVQ